MRPEELKKIISNCLLSLNRLKQSNEHIVELHTLLQKARSLNIVTCTRAEIEELVYGVECLHSELGDLAASKGMEYDQAKSYLDFQKAKLILGYREGSVDGKKYTQEVAKLKTTIDLYEVETQVNEAKFIYSDATNTWKSAGSIVSVFQSLLKNR